MRHVPLILATGSVLCLVPGQAFAQWSALEIQTGALNFGLGVWGSQLVGSANFVAGNFHAMLWAMDGSAIDLHPAGGFANSEALGVARGHQVGYVRNQSPIHACMWTGTASSFIDLHPTSVALSQALGTDGIQQVGYTAQNGDHASLWSGTAASWIDLNPSGAGWSQAYGVDSGKQVGAVNIGNHIHAALWHYTAASLVDLNPTGAAASYAYAVSGDEEVGYAAGPGFFHAGFWTGSASSWTDLNPASVNGSIAFGTYQGLQAGYADIAGEDHASIWFNTAASWTDLQPFTPRPYLWTRAQGVWRDSSGRVFVVGYGAEQSTGIHALLWTSSVPEPSSGTFVICILTWLAISRCQGLRRNCFAPKTVYYAGHPAD